MTAHCEYCPFPGCDSCAYKGGETVTAQRDSGARIHVEPIGGAS